MDLAQRCYKDWDGYIFLGYRAPYGANDVLEFFNHFVRRSHPDIQFVMITTVNVCAV